MPVPRRITQLLRPRGVIVGAAEPNGTIRGPILFEVPLGLDFRRRFLAIAGPPEAILFRRGL